MTVEDTAKELWGGETRKAVDNFPVSGERVPVAVVRWLGRIKGAAARVNADLGLLDADLANRIAAAGDEIAEGAHDDQFPIDVFQTGSGTSSNMNANEVIAQPRRRGRPPERPREHGPVLQRRLPERRPPRRARRRDQPPAARARAARGLARRQGRRVRGHRQVRPHPPDGRRAGHARPGVRRLRRADPPRRRARPQRAAAGRPDPARRHRHRHRPEHPPGLRRQGAREAHRRHRARDQRARGPVRGAGQPRRAGRAVRRAEGRRRLADQDRQRPRADGLRPARRASASSSCPSCRRAPRSCPARSTR